MHRIREPLRRGVAEVPIAHQLFRRCGRLFEGRLLREVELQCEVLLLRTSLAFELAPGSDPASGTLLELVEHRPFHPFRPEGEATFTDESIGIGHVVDRNTEFSRSRGKLVRRDATLAGFDGGQRLAILKPKCLRELLLRDAPILPDGLEALCDSLLTRDGAHTMSVVLHII